MKSLGLAVFTAFVPVAPAFAADPPAQTPSAKTAATPAKPANKTAAADDPNKQVCERRHVVGSNIEEKICKTQAQWEAERIAVQQDFKNRPSSTFDGVH